MRSSIFDSMSSKIPRMSKSTIIEVIESENHMIVH